MREEKPEWYNDPNWAGYLPCAALVTAIVSALFFAYIFGLLK